MYDTKINVDLRISLLHFNIQAKSQKQDESAQQTQQRKSANMNFTTKAQEHSCHSTTLLLATLRMRECIPRSAQLLIMILHQLQPKELYQRKRWKGLHDKEFSILAPPLKVAGGLPTQQNNKSRKTEYRASTWNVLPSCLLHTHLTVFQIGCCGLFIHPFFDHLFKAFVLIFWHLLEDRDITARVVRQSLMFYIGLSHLFAN